MSGHPLLKRYSLLLQHRALTSFAFIQKRSPALNIENGPEGLRDRRQPSLFSVDEKWES